MERSRLFWNFGRFDGEGGRQKFMFAWDGGDYRWYLDPLAARRGVPTMEFRGPKRADSVAATKP